MLRIGIALLAAALSISPAASAIELEGQVILAKGAQGKPSREVIAAQVYFTPDKPVKVKAPAEAPAIVTVRKEFGPRALTVPVGSTVRFPNQDVILHNVFSVSGKNRFDLGLYRRGEGKSATFEHPGVVRIFCNVHHSMVAYGVVVDTPYYTTPDADGRFRLSQLPTGSGTLTVWHERAEPFSMPLTVPATRPIEVQLKVSKPRVPRHTNKFGKPYARRRSGRSYR